MPKSSTFAALAAVAASCIALPALAQGSPVTPLDVTARAPTSMAVRIVNRDPSAVRRDIRIAADTVCSNAVTNRELQFPDQQWCSDSATSQANRRYTAILRTRAYAQSEVILLSAR
jgi:hypothetical protein